jgi:hypothetical protein
VTQSRGFRDRVKGRLNSARFATYSLTYVGRFVGVMSRPGRHFPIIPVPVISIPDQGR